MRDPRSRFIVNTDRQTVVLLNLKCGYTSVCAAMADHPAWSMAIGSPAEFGAEYAEGRFEGFDFHLVTRDPYERLLSYYWNWFVRFDEHFVDTLGVVNRHFKLLEQRAVPQDFRDIISAGPEGRKDPAIFDQFLRAVPAMWPLDPHMWPQHLVYSDHAIDISNVHRWPISDLPSFLSTQGLDASVFKNRSDIENRERYMTPTLCDVVNVVYARDLAELEYSIRSAGFGSREFLLRPDS